MTLKRFPTRLSGSPMPLSSTPICASRVNVVSFATAHAMAWQSRSTCSWVAPSNASKRCAAAGDEVVDVRGLFGGDRSRRHRVSWTSCRTRIVPRGRRRFHYSVSVAHCAGMSSVGSVHRRVKIVHAARYT